LNVCACAPIASPSPSGFGTVIDHGTHALRLQQCHLLDTAKRQFRPERTHGLPTGSACHQLDVGAAPQLMEGSGCHHRDLVAGREPSRRRARGSVRAGCDHEIHRLGSDSTPEQCTSCARTVAGPPATMPTVTEGTCDSRHGLHAFTVIAAQCIRRHGAP
jgi:hypothetical protein